MYMRNFKKKNLSKLLSKTGFTFIEVMAALAISSISLVAMVKISLQMTQLALQNDAADEATQIASQTAEDLIRLRQGDTTSTIPVIYSLCGGSGLDSSDSATYTPSQYTSTTYNPQRFFPMYFVKDSNNSLSLRHNNIYTGSNLAVGKKVDSLSTPTQPYVVDFVKDNYMDTNDIFYRFIGLQYNPTYKIMLSQVIVYWSLYGKDYYYVSYPTFSLAGIC